MYLIPSFKKLLWQTTVLTGFLSLRLLLVRNMDSFSWNEVDVLPLAKHYADPSWVSQDWYLSQSGGYRLLFERTVGWLIVSFGFLATSIIGRLFCYSLVATGLVLIGRKLRLSLPFLLLATIFFAGQGVGQGAIAGEWMVGGLEAKAVAYGLILIAIALMLAGRYRGMALLLGLATSFHVLVGGWAFLTTLGWFCLRPSNRLSKLKDKYLLLLLLYATASACAFPSILQQLTSNTQSAIAPSYIYVFFRLSHHLNPSSWNNFLWIKLTVHLLLLGASIVWIKRQADRQGRSPAYFAQIGLAEFTLVSLIPFIGGLAIAPFDSQGQWLQYYPFRFGDVMLPLTAFLLVACVLEHQTLSRKRIKSLFLVMLVICGVQTTFFVQNLLALQQFPSQKQDVNPQWQVMSEWIRFHTPEDAVVVSSPVQLINFTWLTERSTIAKFKLFPQTKAQILEYYQRLDDLSGNQVWLASLDKGKVTKAKTLQVLNAGFEQLSTSQAEALMNKYHASYFLTDSKHSLNLKVAYRYDPYILYVESKPNKT